jgi:hypothetical protein
MPHFTYSARALDGRQERGVISAATLDEARERLRKRALTIEEIKQTEATTPLSAHHKQGAPSWVVTDTSAVSPTPSLTAPEDAHVAEYAPLTDTFRLFAGWLLAWYAIVYLLGSYQRQYVLPYELSFIDNMFASTLVLRFAFGTFLFLFLNSIHRTIRGGFFLGFLLLLVWIAVIVGFVMYT